MFKKTCTYLFLPKTQQYFLHPHTTASPHFLYAKAGTQSILDGVIRRNSVIIMFFVSLYQEFLFFVTECNPPGQEIHRAATI